MFVRASQYKRREENELDATEWFVALIICWTCFWHLYAHHQELETILLLLLRVVCNDLVAGGRLLGAEQQVMRPGWGKFCESHNFPHPGFIACCSAPNSRPPATKSLYTICSNNTSIVSSSWYILMYPIQSAAKWNKLKWRERSKVKWNEVKWSAV